MRGQRSLALYGVCPTALGGVAVAGWVVGGTWKPFRGDLFIDAERVSTPPVTLPAGAGREVHMEPERPALEISGACLSAGGGRGTRGGGEVCQHRRHDAMGGERAGKRARGEGLLTSERAAEGGSRRGATPAWHCQRQAACPPPCVQPNVCIQSHPAGMAEPRRARQCVSRGYAA